MPECQSKEQMHKKEREKIEELKPDLNYVIPTRTFQEPVEDNREYVGEFDKNYCRENREHTNETRKQWKENNTEQIKQYTNTYEKHREHILEKKNDYQKNTGKIQERRKRQPCQCEICGKTRRKDGLSKHIKTQH